MILIVAPHDDVHARSVAAEIESAKGEAVILDMDEFGTGGLLSHRIGRGESGAITARAGRRIAFEEIGAIWARRVGWPRPDPQVRDPDDRSFVVREWDAAVDGLLAAAGIELVNPVWAQNAAVKPLQLALARRAGLRVPDTLISNQRETVERFVDEHRGRVVHKVLTVAKEGVAETRAWREGDHAALPDLAYAPTIFQERIDAAYDVRATVIGPDIFAMRIAVAPDTVDSRFDFDAECKPMVLSDAVQDRLRRLMKELNLVFGAIDLRVTPEGEFVFFEINPQGQFLFVEILTGLPLSAALARYLLSAEASSLPIRRRLQTVR
jgi:glutathione synthase/RimK-type ligase-like ATP-grasp enzyme